MSSTFDEMDFTKNSRDVLVVRALRVGDIRKALRCSLSFAYAVIKEIRGDAKADGTLAFILPSQLAAWAYRRAGGGQGEQPPKPRPIVAAGPTDAVRRATAGQSAQQSPIPVTTPRTKPRGKR